MHQLTRLWETLDRTPFPTAVTAEWEAWLGEEVDAIQPFLHPERRLSTSYPCPYPGGEDCPRRVVVHGPEDIVAVCGNAQPGCEPLPLRRDDIVAWRFDVGAFAAELGRLLGCRKHRGQSAEVTAGYALGALMIGGARVQVYFALPSRDTRSIDHLVARQPTPQSLLVLPLPHSLKARDAELLNLKPA